MNKVAHVASGGATWATRYFLCVRLKVGSCLSSCFFFSSPHSGAVNSCPENPFRICFDIQLDLHEPAGGCQPNLGLIPALYVCVDFCVCVRTPAS